MSVNCRFESWSLPRRARLAAALLLSVLTVPLGIAAQAPSQFLIMPGCYVPPPPPANDGFPIAVTDSLQTVAAPLVFTGATLLANDTGAAPLSLVAVAGASTAGGTISGAGPYTYTPPAGFTGNDTFSYQIQNPIGNAVGVVNVAVLADQIAPSVSLTAPAAGSVSGNVLVAASATDNVGVAGVKFFDGATQIGAEDTAAPYQVTWNTSSVANGPHSLTAIARDAAGNTASAAVAVTVSNVTLTAPTVDKAIFSEGSGKRTTAAFSTTASGDVLVAFVASDGPAAQNGQTVTVSGAGLTWTRVKRQALSFGDAEIWTATASSILTNVTVSSTQSSAGVHQLLAVIAFKGSSGVGAASANSGANIAASTSLATTSPNSLVYAVGNDWDSATPRTLAPGQTKVREDAVAAVGDTFWVQATSAPIVATGTGVGMATTAPTLDQWNMAAVEIKAGTPPPPPPQVTVPNVVNMLQAAAQTTLSNAGFTSTVVTVASSAAAGTVVSQSPTGGSSAAAGSAVALSVSLGPAPPPPPAAGPVLTLSFNEASGTTAVDGSGNNNNGTISGATRVTGQTGFGGALQFNGSSSIVNIAHSASLALTNGMTLEAWVNPSANAGTSVNDGWRTVIMKERSTTGLAYGLYSNDGDSNPSRPAGYIRNNGTDVEAANGPAVPIGVWTHLAVTYDGTTLRLYVNGVLRNSVSAPGGINASTAPLRIGGNTVFSVPGTEYFAGLIDEVRIYNRALSAAEITADMNTPLP
jgi:hypothetical protein